VNHFGSGPVETIAVYQETIIKTYGFQIVEGLSMLLMRVPNDQMSSIESLFAGAEGPDPKFQAVFSQSMGTDSMSVCLLVDTRKEREIKACVQRTLQGTLKIDLVSVKPVDLICFHGPHFGDRYGIAQAVFQSLRDRSITVLASEFSQSTVILVLQGGAAEAAKSCLSGAFQVPTNLPVRPPQSDGISL
jgi:aspartokinase